MIHLIAIGVLSLGLAAQNATAQPQGLSPDISVRRILSVERNTIRIAKDPRDNTLYIAGQNGTIARVDLAPEGEESSRQTLYSVADHGVRSDWAIGFVVGPDGTMYIGGAQRDGLFSVGTIAKGVVDPETGGHTWSILARTEPYRLNGRANDDHQFNEIIISPDGRWLYLNNGSRTDHGQLDDNRGNFPGLREIPISNSILRLPADGQDLVIPVEEEALRSSGYLFAKGIRNTFDMAFAPNGDLFGIENGPDRDMSEELNWLRQGHHYGFPWRMGVEDNPQQFPDYDPEADLLVPHDTFVGRSGQYHNDPDYPPPPADVVFTDPVISHGPDADFFRDPQDGQIKDASALGLTVSSFTAHRSPLGLVFDYDQVLAPPFKGDGFTFSIGSVIAGALAFDDPDNDLLHLDLEKLGDGYRMQVTRIADGFNDGPIDAEIVGNRIYVMELNGARTLWEITLPLDTSTAVEDTQILPSGFGLDQNYPNPFNPSTAIRYQLGADTAVDLTIFDAAGQKIRTLVSAYQRSGNYAVEWDGTTNDGRRVASGTYVYRLEAGDYIQTRQLSLVK
jgi:hypothetical protein